MTYNTHQMYRRIQQEAQAEAQAQGPAVDCQAQPQRVPEILHTTGGYAVLVRDRIVDDFPYNDGWGTGR